MILYGPPFFISTHSYSDSVIALVAYYHKTVRSIVAKTNCKYLVWYLQHLKVCSQKTPTTRCICSLHQPQFLMEIHCFCVCIPLQFSTKKNKPCLQNGIPTKISKILLHLMFLKCLKLKHTLRVKLYFRTYIWCQLIL